MKKILLFIASVLSLLTYSQTWNQLQKIVASDRSFNKQFGNSVDIDNRNVIVGTWVEDRDANGSNSLQMAGAVYMFSSDGGNNGGYSQKQKLVAFDRHAVAEYGYDVAISGNFAIVGSPANDYDATGANYLDWAGGAYIYEKQGTNWVQVQKIIASDRQSGGSFGFSVDIDSNIAVVGTYNTDVVVGSNTLTAAGQVYIFEKNTSGTWVETQILTASDLQATDYFGTSVAVSGNRVIVGSHQNNLDASGNNFEFFTGAAYIFEKQTSGTWTQMQKIVANDRRGMAYFGWAVGIHKDFALIGAYGDSADASGNNNIHNAGSAYLFELNTSNLWIQKQKIVAPFRDDDNKFGFTVDLYDSTAVVGAFQEGDTSNTNTMTQAGSAYVYKRSTSGTWNMVKEILSSDIASGDYYGYDVAIKKDRIISGAVYEDQDASGTNTMNNAGSAYIFYYGSLSSGISETENNLFAVYPNPASSSINIRLKQNGNYTVAIKDVMGKTIETFVNNNDRITSINLIDYSNGIYFIQLLDEQNGNSTTEKIIINK